MQFIKSLQRTNSFKTNNAQEWSKKELELFFRSIGLELFTSKIFSKQNPLFSSVENGEMFLTAVNNIFNNTDTMLQEKSSCIDLYDPYAKLDTKSLSFLVSSVSHLIDDLDIGLYKVHELEGLIGAFLHISIDNQSYRSSNNSKATKPSAKFDSIPTHPLIKQRLNQLNLYLKIQKTYFQELSEKNENQGKEIDISHSGEEENDFYNFQQNFVLDHFIALQYFRFDQNSVQKNKVANQMSSSSESGLVEDQQFLTEGVKFGHLRKLSIQLNNLKNNVNHYDENFTTHEKNKGSKSLFFASSGDKGFFVSQSIESVEAAFIGNGVDCRLLTTHQVMEYLRYRRIMKKSSLLQIIDLNEIDGQVFVTMRDPMEWKVLLYPYRNEIPGAKNGSVYECICTLANALANIVKAICKNNFKLGENKEARELKQLEL
ncbi:predicted protein [Naegleria gruberi]|uniref:Predicted protein n=1 Tax=Naegleria gruberi TaxID=5762 RepID=D2VCF1_NAEGR|nr:uncharacterized protein NAEGRDRAFT_48411 [Naegleria gruberi]EFC45295.1 predicted protein [Naegleria gruberi]|eukprot:XP_002678039.1 predicted protein [Naegleria gruberi strain NEG-M]